MLTNKKITFEAKTTIEDKEIARYIAVLDLENGNLSFYPRQLDTDACKKNRDIVRADQAEFEDFVYSIQDGLTAE